MAHAEIGKRYRHYKQGKQYTVLHIAYHTERNEELVIYQAEYDTEDLGPRPVFARPKKMFEEKINTNGVMVDRFSIL